MTNSRIMIKTLPYISNASLPLHQIMSVVGEGENFILFPYPRTNDTHQGMENIVPTSII